MKTGDQKVDQISTAAVYLKQKFPFKETLPIEKAGEYQQQEHVEQ